MGKETLLCLLTGAVSRVDQTKTTCNNYKIKYISGPELHSGVHSGEGIVHNFPSKGNKMGINSVKSVRLHLSVLPLSLSLSHYHTRFFSLFHTLSLSNTLTLSLILTLSHSLPPSLPRSVSEWRPEVTWRGLRPSLHPASC